MRISADASLSNGLPPKKPAALESLPPAAFRPSSLAVTRIAPPEIVTWLEEVRAAGIATWVVSNNFHTKDVERSARELGCEAVIHMDPVADEDDETAALHRRILAVLRAALDRRVTLHDFRAARLDGRLRVSFDALVPYDVTEANETLQTRVRGIVEALDPGIDADVTVDRPFVEG